MSEQWKIGSEVNAEDYTQCAIYCNQLGDRHIERQNDAYLVVADPITSQITIATGNNEKITDKDIKNVVLTKMSKESNMFSLLFSMSAKYFCSNKYIYVSRSFFITNPFDVYAQSYIALSILANTVGFSSGDNF